MSQNKLDFVWEEPTVSWHWKPLVWNINRRYFNYLFGKYLKTYEAEDNIIGYLK